MKFRKNTNYTLIVVLALFVGLLISACAPNYVPPKNEPVYTEPSTLSSTFSPALNPKQPIVEKKFSSDGELVSFWKTTGSTYSPYNSRFAMGGVMMEKQMLSSDVALAAPSAVPDSVNSNEGDFSTTNNQVVSIDEADMFKTDGKYIYTITANNVFIVKAYPAENMDIVKVITYNSSNRYPQELFVYDGKLVVLGNGNGYVEEKDAELAEDGDELSSPDMVVSAKSMPPGGYYPTQYNPIMFIDVYDISDIENPEKVKEIVYEGNYFKGRMKDGIVYTVSSKSPDIDITPYPIWYDNGVKNVMPIGDIIYYPIPYNYPVYQQISALDLDHLDAGLVSEAIVVEGGDNLYMSENNIYLTYNKYINEYEIRQRIMRETIEPLLTADEKALISKIDSTDDDILNQYEKKSKIWAVYERHFMTQNQASQDALSKEIDAKTKAEFDTYDAPSYTIIHRVSIDGVDIKAETSGMVPGRVVNQFSLDEHNDVLRIATTQDQWWGSYGKDSWKEMQNFVFTLDMDLTIIDTLDGIAPKEQIYSTRFIDDRLYMVTFRQVDPFFVIDLSNPEKIEMLGELKIPGFSRYLHPYDENTIIGIGRDATDTGRQEGLKISLFDVTNVEKPTEIAKYVGTDKYASSNAEYEHRAFLFSKKNNLLVIPIYNYDYESKDSYNGALVFNISREEIAMRGLINHGSDNSGYYWQPSVERSAYIENVLYTKSAYLLRANDLGDLHGIANVTLRPDAERSIPIY